MRGSPAFVAFGALSALLCDAVRVTDLDAIGSEVRAGAEACLGSEAAAASQMLASAASKFLEEQVSAADLAAVRGSRLMSHLERRGVSVEQSFTWHLLHAALSHPMELAAGTGVASSQAELLDEDLAKPQGPPEAAACGLKLGGDGKWARRELVLRTGTLVYRPTDACRSKTVMDWFRNKVDHEQSLELKDMLPDADIEALSAAEVSSDEKERADHGWEKGWDYCVMLPLRNRDFVACFDVVAARDAFADAARLHQSFAAGGKSSSTPAALPAGVSSIDEALAVIGNEAPGLAERGAAEESLEGTVGQALIRAQLSPSRADSSKAGAALAALKTLTSMTKQVAAASPTPLSVGDRTAYRRQRLQESMKYFASSAELSGEQIADAHTLLTHASRLNSELDRALKALDEANRVQWGQVEQAQGGFANALKLAVKKVGRALVDSAIKVSKFVRQSWKSFKTKFVDAEQKCAEEDHAIEQQAVQDAGLKIASIKQEVEQGKDPKREDVDSDVEKAGTVLQQMAGSQAQVQQSEHSATVAAADLQQRGAQLQAALAKAESKDADLEKAAQGYSEAQQRALQRVCQRSRIDEAAKMKQVFGNFSLPSILKPQLGIRGNGGSVPLFQAGVEEVVDFRNREIGYYKWAANYFGSSILGAGVSSFLGVGWKGYKKDWTLQETYQIGIWASKGISVPLGLISGGATYSTDADDSGKHWVADRQGVNAVLVSWGVGAGVDFSPVSLNMGMTRHWMFTSECYDSRREFLLGLWGVTCSSCREGAEKWKMGALRVASHLTSFPVLADLLFTALAFNTDAHLPENHTRECSVLSTKHRDDGKYVTSTVGRELTQALESLQSVRLRIKELEDDLAVAGNEDQLVKSKEFGQLQGAFEASFCRPLPPGLAGKEVPASLLAATSAAKASKEGPFGTCRSRSDCPLSSQECTVPKGASEGYCSCKEGSCHAVSLSGEDTCAVAGNPVTRTVTGLKAWSSAKALELGTLAESLLRLAPAAATGN